MAGFYLFNYAVRVGRTALHPEILIYIRVCRVVWPKGLSKVLVLCFCFNNFENVEGSHLDKAVS